MTRRTAIVAILSSLFFFSYLYRNSPAVIAPYLIQEFSIGAERLGLLSSIFFYTFAAIQIPLGPALDIMGGRILIAILGVIAAVGSFLFGLAPSYDICLLGRGLIGLGMSCTLMGTLKVLATWYPPKSFATVTGLILSLGLIGSFTATLPLALITTQIGWRNTFFVFASINLLLALLVWVFVRNHPPNQAPEKIPEEDQFEIKKAFQFLFHTPSFWTISLLSFFIFGAAISIQSLWGGPFMMDIFQMTPAQAGSILSFMAFGQMAGSFLTGFISDRLGIPLKKIAAIWSGLFLIPIVLFSFFLKPGYAYFLIPSFLIMGFTYSVVVVFMAQLKMIFPPQMLGTVLTCFNLFGIGGAAVLQFTMGMIIERFPTVGHSYPIQAYRQAFYLLLAGMVLSFILYLKIRIPVLVQEQATTKNIQRGRE
jgi:sugar phosphate permease